MSKLAKYCFTRFNLQKKHSNFVSKFTFAPLFSKYVIIRMDMSSLKVDEEAAQAIKQWKSYSSTVLQEDFIPARYDYKELMQQEKRGPSKKYTKEELQKRLTPMQYHVTQEKGTERPFTGELEKNKAKGEYKCVVCGNLLFKSDHKFESGSGWPSFYQTAAGGAVERIEDSAHGMKRVEVVCKDCSAHLGHVFEDGPKPSGERFCMNSASLAFEKK